jgi:hypothetical protein
MDGHRFDDLTRTLARGSRRRLLAGLAGTLLSGSLARGPVRSAAAACPAEQVFRPRVGCICRATGRPPVGGVCPCPAGKTYCPDGCVDLLRDGAHCGTCDLACPEATPICFVGTCVECTQALHCDDDGDPCTVAACVAGACLQTPVAVGGACLGQSGICCGGACVDSTSDPANCGGCGVTCGPNQSCLPTGCVNNPGVTVDPTTVDVDEAGPTTDTYTIVLDTQPAASVDIIVNVGDGQVEVSNGGPFSSTVTLTFTMGDWNTPQTVTVRAVDDIVDETSPHTGTIEHTASSSDLEYDGISLPDVIANITDNDTAGVTIAESAGSTDVDETGPTIDTYTVVLDTQPSATVTIDANALGGQTEVSTDNSNFFPTVTLTFTTGNWFTPQTVYVRALDDAVDEASPHTGTITHTTSGAAEYAGIAISSVNVNITDNDAP